MAFRILFALVLACLSSAVLEQGIVSAQQAPVVAPFAVGTPLVTAPAPAPGNQQVQLTFINATCIGSGAFLGAGNFSGAGAYTATSGFLEGTGSFSGDNGTFEGNASCASPASTFIVPGFGFGTIKGINGSLSGVGIFGLPSGSLSLPIDSLVEGFYEGSSVVFNGKGSFAGNGFLEGAGVVKGQNIFCNGTGNFGGVGLKFNASSDGRVSTASGTFLGQGSFIGTGSFSGTGSCTNGTVFNYNQTTPFADLLTATQNGMAGVLNIAA